MTSDMPKPDIESSIWIDRSTKDIWNFLSDVSVDTRWRNGVTDAKWISNPPHGIGSTGLHIIEGIGDWPWRVTAFEEPQIWAWEVTGGRFEGSHDAYRIAPEGNGSRFTMETRWKRNVIIKLLGLILKGRIKSANASNLEKLKVILES